MGSSPRDFLCYLGKGTAKCSSHLSQQYTVRLLLQEFILKEDAIKNTTKKELYKGGVTIKPFRLGKAHFLPNRDVTTKKLTPFTFGSGSNFLSELPPRRSHFLSPWHL